MEFDAEINISRLSLVKYWVIVAWSEIGQVASNNYVDIDDVYPAWMFEIDHRKFNEYKFKWNKEQ